MEKIRKFTQVQAKSVGERLGVQWDRFEVEQFWKGMEVELEHGFENPVTNITNNDQLLTGKIALAHLNELPDYYDRLEAMEREAEEYWGSKQV